MPVNRSLGARFHFRIMFLVLERRVAEGCIMICGDVVQAALTACMGMSGTISSSIIALDYVSPDTDASRSGLQS